MPPYPKVKGSAFHMTGYDKTSVRTSNLEKSVPYESWQEEGAPVTIPNKSLIKYRCAVEYAYDESGQIEHDSIIHDFENRLIGKDKYVNIKDANKVPGLTEFVTMSEKGCCVPCMRSKVTKFLYRLLFLLGYHTVFEVIWRGIGATVNFKSRKLMSTNDGLRARKYEKDQQAGAVAHTDLSSIAMPLKVNDGDRYL